jgi:hypothetical protein
MRFDKKNHIPWSIATLEVLRANHETTDSRHDPHAVLNLLVYRHIILCTKLTRPQCSSLGYPCSSVEPMNCEKDDSRLRMR